MEQASLAHLPTSALPALAALRTVPGVMIRPDGDRAWVSWRAGDERVLRCLLPIPGVALFVERDGLWFPPGGHLPSFDGPGPAAGPIPLATALVPGPIAPTPPPADLPPPDRLSLARDDRPRPTSALRCPVADLARWADAAPSAEIAAVRAARSGPIALLMGPALPPIPDAARFWGVDVLIPLGYAPRPDWPAGPLRLALGIAEEAIALIDADATVEAIPRAAFRPLTRAGIRLAIADASGGGS